MLYFDSSNMISSGLSCSNYFTTNYREMEEMPSYLTAIEIIMLLL